jgi:hypothetical protein
MGTFHTAVDISRPPAEVFAFVAEPHNMPRWYDAVDHVAKTTNGPSGPGARYDSLVRCQAVKSTTTSSSPSTSPIGTSPWRAAAGQPRSGITTRSNRPARERASPSTGLSAAPGSRDRSANSTGSRHSSSSEACDTTSTSSNGSSKRPNLTANTPSSSPSSPRPPARGQAEPRRRARPICPQTRLGSQSRPRSGSVDLGALDGSPTCARCADMALSPQRDRPTFWRR